jgi:hypothetical protein
MGASCWYSGLPECGAESCACQGPRQVPCYQPHVLVSNVARRLRAVSGWPDFLSLMPDDPQTLLLGTTWGNPRVPLLREMMGTISGGQEAVADAWLRQQVARACRIAF